MNLEQLRKEIQFIAVRSRGPGGQNVNKVSSAAQLYWNLNESTLLNDEQKARVRNKLATRINNLGELFIRSDEFRDLERNKERGLEKLVDLIKQALHVPKKRKATKPTYSSKVKNKETKKRQSEIKKLRRRVYD